MYEYGMSVGRFSSLEILNLVQYVGYGGDLIMWKDHHKLTDVEFNEIVEYIQSEYSIDIHNHPSYTPSNLDKVKSLVEAGVGIMKNLATGKRTTLPKTKQMENLSICKTCPYYNAQTNRCGKCSCFLSYKTKLSSGKCPIGKW
jgi:hypothetical protein